MNINYTIDRIVYELDRAESLHDWPDDMIHQAAVVSEECGELVQAVNNYKSNKGSYDEVVTEAVQTGAMAVRFLINLKEDDDGIYDNRNKTTDK